MRLHTITLGCQMSAADGEELSRPLRTRGWRHVAAPEEADAIVISTCTVRQHAEDRAVSLIGSLKPWKDADARRVLIVAGCAAERVGTYLRERFPHVDLVVGAKSIDDYPRLVEEALGSRFDALVSDAEDFPESPSAFAPTGSPATAFVTIMRGCNYACSYCIVPSVRGRERYRAASEVLAEARLKLDGGARELTLLGQTVNSYASTFEGRDLRFPDLLRRLDALPGLSRLRFMSPHPYFAGPELLAAMKESRSVCEQLHLPAQSGSDRVLRAMRRNYTRASFLALAEAARELVPGLALSSDFIVGFPGETDAEFEETLSLVARLRPASAFCFKYSPRAGTAAAELPDDVPQELKEERLARLNEAVETWSRLALQAEVGSVVEVLAEQPVFGRTRTGLAVRWDRAVPVGALARVRVISATRRTLIGELHEP